LKFSQWLGAIALIISLIILWQIREVLLLVFTAVLIATVLNRVVSFLSPDEKQEKADKTNSEDEKQEKDRANKKNNKDKKIKLDRGFAVFLTILGLLLILFIFSLAIIPPFVDQFQQLIQKIPLGIEQLRSWLNSWSDQIPDPVITTIENSLSRLIEIAQSLGSLILSNFFTIFSNTLNAILSSLLVLVLTIMLLANPREYRETFTLIFPKSFRDKLDSILTNCEKAISGWSIAILFNMTIIGSLSWIGLLILGVPLALANALLAGLFTFIPNVGPTLSVIPPAAIALVDSPWKSLGVIILYVGIQQLESNVLTPLVMKKQVSMLPAFAILSQLTFAIFFGFLGLFLALPLALILQVIIKEFVIDEIMEKL